MFTVEFDRELTAEVDDPERTLLDVSRGAGLPHFAACGGNGRCSTCRVIVLEGLENVSPRTPAEARLAAVKGLEDDIRLACQTRARGPVKLRRLVIDEEDMHLAQAISRQTTGKERRLAILFADIRDFTTFAENNLPYDVIHVLGRYFRKIGGPVLEHGGFIDKYMGDGIMAIFGLERATPTEACVDAVRAGLAMLERLVELNRYLRQQFDTEFRIGVGVHVGPVIIGELGHPDKMQFTAIGDTVNIASRIESSTKAVGAPLLVSEQVRDLLGDRAVYGLSSRRSLKGKTGEHLLIEVVGMRRTPPKGAP